MEDVSAKRMCQWALQFEGYFDTQILIGLQWFNPYFETMPWNGG